MTARRVVGACMLVCLLLPGTLLAQRQLAWDALDVTAHLDADGVLHVTELQALDFTGDWNGGERIFNLRPRQQLRFEAIERMNATSGASTPLTQDDALDDVDDYAFINERTLRWRCRLPSDRPFTDTRLTYAIRYRISGILLKEESRYLLDHDFAFADRPGDIRRFSLRLTVDPGWQPLSALRDTYAAGPLAPGRSFVLTVPLKYTGTGSPAARDDSRPSAVVAAVAAILGGFVLLAVALLWREHALGRLEPIRADRVNPDWIRQHIVAHPAEVVGAAWDQDVGQAEVVALIARLVAEGKLTSEVTEPDGAMSLALKVDRSAFEGYERALVDALFFHGRTTTSTAAVREQYQSRGFNPADTISALRVRANALLPKGDNPVVSPWPSAALFCAGAVCLAQAGLSRGGDGPEMAAVAAVALITALVAYLPGTRFRQRIDWGIGAVLASLLLPFLVAIGVAWALWFPVGTGVVEWSPWLIGAVTALTLWVVNTAINSLKLRQHRPAIAFRKTLATGRLYFQTELAKPRPALRDEWYPWIAAFGLTKEADRWTATYASPVESFPTMNSSSPADSPSSDRGWTGAAGGRSGGAGGGATWATAVAGLAAGVSAAGASDSSSSGSSSSGGSSGGGGGGGW